VLALFSFLRAARVRSRGRDIDRNISDLAAQQRSLRETAGRAQAEVRQAMTDAGFATIEEFLQAAKHAAHWRQKLADVQARAAASEQQRDQLISACEEIYEHLKDALASVGLNCSPGTLKAQIDVIRANLRARREAEARCRSLAEQLNAMELQTAALAAESRSLEEEIGSILQQGGVPSPQEFREACRKQLRAAELQQRLDSRFREFQRLSGGLTLQQWRENAARLRAEAPVSADSPVPPGDKGPDSEPLLPYLPGAEEAEQDVQRVAAALAAAREDHARLHERVQRAFENTRPLPEIEEDLATTEAVLNDLSLNRQALETASETIQTLSRQQQEVLAPQLNNSVEQRFLRLCNGRYVEVKIDPDFQIWLRERADGELRSIDRLSRGAQDQLYFALRFGILDVIANGNEACPALLDEPFAAYDRGRMEEAFRILADESKRRQLLLFSCREDLLEIARNHSAHIIGVEPR
jgi:uncharacterized protein YhaN